MVLRPSEVLSKGKVMLKNGTLALAIIVSFLLYALFGIRWVP